MSGALALLDAAGGSSVVSGRLLALAATVVAAGAVTFRLTVARTTGEGEATAVRWGMWASALLLVCAVPRLWLQARGLVDPGDPVLPMAANVLGTRWGEGWLLQLAGAIVTGAGFIVAARRPTAGRWLCVAGTAALVVAPAFMGHAIAVRRLRWLAVTADVAHTLAAASWTGALTMLAACAARLRGSAARGETLARMIAAFHPVALISAAVVVATGAAGVWLRVDPLSSLLRSGYGAILAAKVALAIGVAAFGARHARRGQEDARRGATTLERSLRAEVLLALLTIVATALLTGSPPEPDA
ncbi:MAG: CopD family protein [Gemmatimonadetes bacterium]|nr:CopD family protein [Gemmatimonadota bacterium]